MKHFIWAFVALILGSVALAQPVNIITSSTGKLRKEVCVTPTVTTASAYGTNFVVGGLLTFTNALGNAGTGAIRGASININRLESSGFTITLFTTNPSNTTWTDNMAAAINSADVNFARWSGNLTGSVSSVLATSGYTLGYVNGSGVGPTFPIVTAPLQRNLFGVVTTNAALTTNFSTASDVQVCLVTEID